MPFFCHPMTAPAESPAPYTPPLPRLLLVDDDETFVLVAARALRRRGFEVDVAHDSAAALTQSGAETDYAVIDLMLGNESGLDLLPQLKARNPSMFILMLTGYASIATTVDAIKLGADNYLAKPADADAIVSALHRNTPGSGPLPEVQPPSLAQVKWEHIQRVLAEHGGNISAASRSLNMHRRTLQRMLNKKRPG
jgi:two-component system, response regulator RegA